MKRTVIFVLLILMSAGSCKNESKPPGVLSQKKMVEVLTEIYINEEKVKRLNLPQDSSKKVFNLLKEKIYEKTGTDDSIYHVSFQYYLDHPKEMELIYTALVDSLQLKEQLTPERVAE